MLFTTCSASVYGIDAYLVEVDVGSADTNQFNVVALPENVAQESGERIKAALMNCGFAFPYGQGVTADIRKEGSASDLPCHTVPWTGHTGPRRPRVAGVEQRYTGVEALSP
jgi:hypothetical protein